MAEESSSFIEETFIPVDYQPAKEGTKNLKVERVTSNRMTRFEKTRIVGTRALQLSMNAPPLVDIEDETDPVKIALKELKQGKMPYILRRILPDGSIEDWSIKEMILPYD